MKETEINTQENEAIYLSLLAQGGGKDIKLKLGLAELIFQGLILLLLV